jgi:hypothetical protein
MAILEQMRKTAARLLASTVQDDDQLIRYVAEVRDGERAQAARASRAQADTVWDVDADPEVGLAKELLQEILTLPEFQAVQARCELLAPKPVIGDPVATALARPTESPEYREADALRRKFLVAAAAAEAWVREAKDAARLWIYERRRHELRALDAELLDVAQRAVALARTREAFLQETVRLAGRRDPEAPEHPVPALVMVREQLERLRTRQASASTTPTRQPPARGYVRVRVLERFETSERRRCFPRDATGLSGIEDIPEGDVKEVVERGWAERA